MGLAWTGHGWGGSVHGGALPEGKIGHDSHRKIGGNTYEEVANS
jgi:hypothetical protein